MKYVINNDGAKDLFLQIDMKLNAVEVKGDSVGNLYIARKLLNQLFNSMQEIKDDKPSEPKKEA